MSKQYEYAVEYVSKDGVGYAEFMFMTSYEEAMSSAKYLHNKGATEVKIIRREVSDWKPIHQSGFSAV